MMIRSPSRSFNSSSFHARSLSPHAVRRGHRPRAARNHSAPPGQHTARSGGVRDHRSRRRPTSSCRDHASRGDVKLLATALRELRYCFKVFAALPRAAARPRSSAPPAPSRTTRPIAAAVEFGRRMAESGWMVITGAGGGIMEAGHVGAGPRQQLRPQHPAAVRAVRQPRHPRRPEAHDHAVLLHPQADVHQGVGRGRALPRRLRHARRGVRGAHARADRQVAHLPHRDGRRARRRLLEAVAALHRGQPAGARLHLPARHEPVPRDRFGRGGGPAR